MHVLCNVIIGKKISTFNLLPYYFQSFSALDRSGFDVKVFDKLGALIMYP